MSDDLISRSELRKRFQAILDRGDMFCEYDIIGMVDNAPTVEIPVERWDAYCEGQKVGYEKGIEERPQGEWIEENSETGALGIKYTWFKCNQCNWISSLVIPKNFCPNCGADMRGGKQ